MDGVNLFVCGRTSSTSIVRLLYIYIHHTNFAVGGAAHFYFIVRLLYIYIRHTRGGIISLYYK